jgi:hypothetical protein
MEANIAKSKLLAADIYCFLKDEHMLTINPALSNGLGGIKLQVNEADVEVATQLLEISIAQYNQAISCPICSSKNVHFVTSLKNFKNWIGFLFSVVFMMYPPYLKKVYCCEKCGNEFENLENSHL